MVTEGSRSRRTFIAGIGGASFLGVATTPGRSDSATVRGVVVEPIATGFTAPIDIETPPDRPTRHYVADQPGVIYRVDEGSVTGNPVLDLRDSIVELSGYEERGLLGMALHPRFGENRRFYVRYSALPRSGTPAGYDHTFVLSEFTATADGTGVIAGSERTLLEIPEPQSNHNAGSIAFGPEGYLYVGVGDGGAANDQGMGHVSDWYDDVDGGNGQDVTANLLGSVLRIDPDDRSGDRPYGIPEDNPLIGEPGLDEHYAWGFRNPWRLSFDGTDLYVADVGQNRYEEVNRVVAGGNYGWNVREGTHCFKANSCPVETPPGDRLRDPIIEYSHPDDADPGGLSVIGGYRYRGSAMPPLTGAYLFTDWQFKGRLFVARPPDDGGLWPITVLPVQGTSQAMGQYALAFGRTPADELLVCTTNRATVAGQTGAIHRFSGIETTTATTTTTTTSPSETTTETTTDGQPGFGLLGTVLGIGGVAGYALARRVRQE